MPILPDGRVLRLPQRPVETPRTYSNSYSLWMPPNATTTITIIEHGSTDEEDFPPSRLLSVSSIPEHEVPPSPERVFTSADAHESVTSINCHLQTRSFYPIDPAHKRATLLNLVEATIRPLTPVPAEDDSDHEDVSYLLSLVPPSPTNTTTGTFDDDESDDEYLDDSAGLGPPSMAAPFFTYPVCNNGDSSGEEGWDVDDEDEQGLARGRALFVGRVLNFEDTRPGTPLRSFLDMSTEDSDEDDSDEYPCNALIFDDEFTVDQIYRDRRTPDLRESVLDRTDRASQSQVESLSRRSSESGSRTGRDSQVLLDDVFNPDVTMDLFSHPEPEEHPYALMVSSTQRFYECDNPNHIPHLRYEHCCTNSVHPYQHPSFAPFLPFLSISRPRSSASSLLPKRSTRSAAGKIVHGLTKSLRGAFAKVPSNAGSRDAKGKKRMRTPDFEVPNGSSSTSLLSPFRLKRAKKF
ncbi:uncharacterized protein BT62DRAFT_938342 [Guyanagaster necrorhizus]|uniref:Uncharacterized protein n=1 Tax=Guyanagaster necrorhizus TaxID=856835 RepID=A0A9P7VFT4_9AGAR|nr:uncharacterized protein BT62DRAFT_938342 [Guyanagaster necrorhizus MCA 3950]KAG7440143.1 hypothetical protein BT62DRAFT_938342 [Guyanagaster necrorhizus MCA 3950]